MSGATQRRVAIWLFSIALSGGVFAWPASADPVKDFYVFAGQSNMVAAGGEIHSDLGLTLGQTIPNVKIWLNCEEGESCANDFEPIRLGQNTAQFPQDTQNSFNNFGPEFSFGESANAASPNHEIYFVKYAKGGTSLLKDAEWDPGAGGALFVGLKDEIQSAKTAKPGLAGRLKCFVWGQGEADRNNTSQLGEYRTNFKKLIDAVRLRANSPDAPVALIELSYKGDDSSILATTEFREMQRQLVQENSNVQLVNVDDLTKVDYVHYDAASLLKLGRRIFTACRR